MPASLSFFLVYITGFSPIYPYTNRDFVLLPWKNVENHYSLQNNDGERCHRLIVPIKFCAQMTDSYSSIYALNQIVDNLFGHKATQHTQMSTPQNCKLLSTFGLCILNYDDQQRKSCSIPPKAMQIATLFHAKHKPSLTDRPAFLCRY